MNEFIKKLIERLEESRKSLKVGEGKIPITLEFHGAWISAHDAAIEIVNQLAEEYNNDVCEWTGDDKEIDVYYTKCGQAHIFIDGSPAENNHEFCPYCGKKIKVVE